MITRFLWWYIFWGTIYYIKPYFAVIYYKRKTRNIVIVFLYSIVVWIRPIVNGKKPLQFHRDLIPFPFSIMELHNKVKVWESCFSVLPTLRILISFWSETNSLFIQMCICASCDSRLETLHILPSSGHGTFIWNTWAEGSSKFSHKIRPHIKHRTMSLTLGL